MIVSHSHRFVFVHIPKTGGTTIERILSPYLEAGRDVHVSRGATLPWPEDAPAALQRVSKHASAPQIRRRIGKQSYDRYLSFAVSRNPFARCFSAYRFQVARAEADIHRAKKGLSPRNLDKSPGYSAFLNLDFEETCRRLPELAKVYTLFQPQTMWLPRPDSVDFVGRLENLAEDLDVIFTWIGLPKDGLANITPANQKTAPAEWRGMTPECAGLIRQFYAQDFERFGYSPDFNGPDTAPARPLRDRKVSRRDVGLLRRLWARFHDRVPA